MRPDVCEEMSRRLVNYSDGELPSDQIQEVKDHLAACPECAKLLKALDVSLTMTTRLWENALNSSSTAKKTVDAEGSTFHLWAWKTAFSVAACLTAVVSLSLIWRSASLPVKPPPTLAEIEQTVRLSGRAAKQLRVAEILASCDGTEEILARHHHYMAETLSMGH
jgi:hypothetical protein